MKFNFEKLPDNNWQEYQDYHDWYVQPSGEQIVKVANGGLELDTGHTQRDSETYASLVTSQASFSFSKLNVTYETVAQHREQPNDWEVGWVLWNFENVNRFYSAILKPEGWEIAKEWIDSEGVQRQDFLGFSTKGRFPVGQKYNLQIKREVLSDTAVAFTLSAKGLTTGSRMRKMGTVVDDGTRESGPAYFGGKLGLYVEDCKTRYYEVTVK